MNFFLILGLKFNVLMVFFKKKKNKYKYFMFLLFWFILGKCYNKIIIFKNVIFIIELEVVLYRFFSI